MGAFTFIVYSGNQTPYNIKFVKSISQMKARGPDMSNTIVDISPNLSHLNKEMVKKTLSRNELYNYKQQTYIYVYHRNAINDPSYDGVQPFEDPIQHMTSKYIDLNKRPKRLLMCNGEIYNYLELITENGFTDKDLQSESDVEVILPMYIKYGLEETLRKIQGEFSFVLTENLNGLKQSDKDIFVVRDQLGTRPLYYLKHNSSDFRMFTTELKSIPLTSIDLREYTINEIPPGHYWSLQKDTFIQYFDINTWKHLEVCKYNSTEPIILDEMYNKIKNTLIGSIKRRSRGVERLGVLLSGGLDSGILLSLIASMKKELDIQEIHTFTLGYNESSENVKECERVVEFLEKKHNIDIHHHNILLSQLDVCMSSMEDIIFQLETYEPEIVRDSVPYYFLMKYISNYTDIKVVLSGDGLDEYCGYSEFNDLSDQEFQAKSCKLLENMHKFDLKRTDQIAGNMGIEVRYPYLDTSFLELMMTIHPKLKRSQQYKLNEPVIEKYIIRKTFENGYLPESCLWKRLGFFSEYYLDFQSEISNLVDLKITDKQFSIYVDKLYNEKTPFNIMPQSKEEMYYREIYVSHFGKNEKLITQFWKDNWI